MVFRAKPVLSNVHCPGEMFTPIGSPIRIRIADLSFLFN